jgi:Rab GDP dissociation inhibitor
MNEEYDVIVLGTGLKECILSGLLSVKGKKVLHLDRNGYYGGETASLNLTNLWQKFRPGVEPPKEFGHNREWNVDLVPKFIMANGVLVKMLLHTKVTRYLEWKCVDGSFVLQNQKGGFFSSAKSVVHKVPSNDSEALHSPLMGLFEKKRCRDFYIFCQDIDFKNPKTWKDIDIFKQPMRNVFKKFKLEENTIDFLGHAVALYNDDDYLNQPAHESIKKIQLYVDSLGKYGDSPFLYPIYGLGGLPESFSRLCAIHGGTYMLNTPVHEILMQDNKVVGIKSGKEEAKAPMVICDPSYVQGGSQASKVRAVGRVIRAICILDHPIPNTNDSTSCQIILPQKQIGRRSDIYISMVSSAHAVCAKGLFIAMVSAFVETDKPELEIRPALDILGGALEVFTDISTLYEPTTNG